MLTIARTGVYAALFAAVIFTAAAPVAGAETTSGAKAGQVWSTGATYHCPGTRYFGATKAGQYVGEAEAAKAGAKPARGKTCAAVAEAAKTKAAGVAKPKAAKPA